MYVGALPSGGTNTFLQWESSLTPSGVSPLALKLTSDGTFSVNNTAVTNVSISADSKWHLIQVDVNGTSCTLYVDGVAGSTVTITSFSATTALFIGWGSADFTSNGFAATIYIDDLIVDDSTAVIGGGNQRLLLPTADPVALNSWTNGGGGTTSIFEGVNNIPPTGVAASTNGVKIKNAASGSNLDYTPTMQTYTAAGVPSGSVVNAVMAVCNHGEEVSTGTKAGAVWIASNPAQSAGSGTFDYGNDSAVVVGTYPTGWATGFGSVTENPSVTLGTAPTMTVRKTGSTTRVVDVDFMGIYVDYTPPRAPSVNDTITTAESVTVSVISGDVKTFSATDTVSVTESTTRQINTERSVSDAATVAESATPSIVSFVSTSDAATVAESITARSSSNVTISEEVAVYESSQYNYVRTITVTSDTAKLPSTLIDFPVLVSVTDASLKTVANGGKIYNTATASTGPDVTVPCDLVFSSDSSRANILAWEIESYSPTTGALTAWVKLPTCSTGLQFYLWYGNQAATAQQNKGTYAPAYVWSSNFSSVYHLSDGTTLRLQDSSSSSNTITTNVGCTAGVGQIDGGASIGANHGLIAPYLSAYDSASCTQSVWFKTSSTTPYQQILFRDGYPSGARNAWIRVGAYSTAGYLEADAYPDLWPRLSSLAPISYGVWHLVHLTLSYDGSSTTAKLYLDGVLQASTTNSGTQATGTSPLAIGTGYDYGASYSDCLDGSVDEVHMASVARSADWITAEYASQNSPSTFLTIGSEASAIGSPYVAARLNFQTVSDTVTSVESSTALPAVSFSATDSATSAESLTARTASNVNVADAATATESASATLNTSASVIDSVAVTESATPSVQTTINATETATVAENSTATVNTSLSISDASTATESAPSAVNTAVDVNDASTGTENASLSIQTAAAGTLSVFDASTAAESATLSVQTTATATDTATATESVSNAVRVLPSVTDSATATESASARLNTSASVVDTATASESVQNAVNVRPSVTDAATVAEAQAAEIQTSLTASDAATASENTTATINTTATVFDAAIVTESATPAVQTQVSATDTATVTESALAEVLTFAIVSDTASATEWTAADVLAYVSVSDAATAAEFIELFTATGGAYTIYLADAATVVEAVAVGTVSNISVADVAAVLDRLTAGIPTGAGWAATVTPVYVITAALTATGTISAAITAAAAPAATITATTAPTATITAAEIVAEIEGI